MFTDYIFWFIKRNDDGFITEAAVRFYEGDYQDKQVEDVNGNIETKSVYVRSNRLEKFEQLEHLAKDVDGKPAIKGITESNGKLCVYYSQKDFGDIKTDDELRSFLNIEISKDKGRQVIPEQKA